MHGRAPRILFLDGSGDLVGAFRSWKSGQEDPGQTDSTFSGQFFDIATKLGARVRAIAWPGDRTMIQEGSFVLEHRRRPLSSTRGALFHLAQVIWALDLLVVALASRSEVVVMQDGPHHWLFAPLRVAGVRLVPIVHNTLWPAGHEPVGIGGRVLLRAEGWFFRHVADATLAVSPECERQIRAAARGPLRGPIAQFRPTYLSPIAPSPADLPGIPFRVLYAGRLEREKGVFDLLEVAARLETNLPGKFRWSICGGGSAERELKSAICSRGLGTSVMMLGHLRRVDLAHEYAACDAVLVPTTGAFPEGLNRSAVEAALSGRPVVISSAAPAAEILGRGALICPDGDIDAYVSALRLLAQDGDVYRAARDAAAREGALLLDSGKSLRSVLGGILEKTLYRRRS